MYCAKCGSEILDGAVFCGLCGTKVENKEQLSSEKVSIQEYFANEASPSTKKRLKIFKVLGIGSLIVQSALLVLDIIAVILFIINIKKAIQEVQDTGLAGSTELFSHLLAQIVGFLVLACLFSIPSFILTYKGLQKKRTGLLIASVFFSFLSMLFGMALAAMLFRIERTARIVPVLAIPIIHIVLVVLNILNRKEYKAYLRKN